MTDIVRERLEKAEAVAAKIERKLAYIVGTHCGVATNDLRILLDAYFDQKDLLFECVAYGDPEIESRLAASPQGEESSPAMSADHIGDASKMIAPVEAVAWRVRRRKEDAGFGRPQVFTTDDASEADLKQWRCNGYEVQPLYTHPTPIKPSGDTGELRERVAKIVDPAGFDDRWDVPGLRHEASLDERVDEALAKADEILDLIQSERAG